MTTSQNRKVEILVDYFSDDVITETDKLWTVALFSHRRPPRAVTTTKIREWCAEIANLPLWLFEDTYHIVGDLAETIALVLPTGINTFRKSLSERIGQLKELKKVNDPARQKELLITYWSEMGKEELFLFNKLLTGGFRVGISQNIIVKALAQYLGKPENEVAHDLMGKWTPDTHSWPDLFFNTINDNNISKPYPFYLAYPLDKEILELGDASEWVAEYKWDGIRGQIIIRNGKIFVWSRGEELMTDKFPEFSILTNYVSDIVLDGEILVMKNGKPSSFNEMQTRIGRKNITKKILEEFPVKFIAYDVLEYEGEDIRNFSYMYRRQKLTEICTVLHLSDKIHISEYHEDSSWDKFAEWREQSSLKCAEGLMLKRKDSPYQAGRKKGEWFKWKIDPYTIDAVMIYAQRGHGRRANLFTDFTFAIYDNQGILVPFTKAYSGLTDEEFREVTTWVKANTIERFGPVCSVSPQLVFELAFEGIAYSKRHKSGVALRFPRIKSWRKDKPVSQIDTLETLKALIV